MWRMLSRSDAQLSAMAWPQVARFIEKAECEGQTLT